MTQPLSGPPRRYTVTRLLEPERAPAPRRRGGLWTRSGVVLVVGLLFTGISTALPGGTTEAVTAEPPPNKSARVTLTEGEWLTIVGVGLPVEPLAPGWSLAPTDEPTLPPALQPLPEAAWAPPSALKRVLDTSARAASLAQLAEAGGETRLLSRYAPPWLWTSMDLPDAPRTRLPVTLPPALDGLPHDSGPAAWVEGIGYHDPVGIGLPLLRVRGFESFPVSAHFTVADFATRDGAPYARISPDLVTGLEQMRALLGPLTVISGYRHPRYNADPSVGGARYSRHQAGQAADVWSPTRTSLQIAMAAVQAIGCGVGLGLGENTVHVDVRGYLKTWTYPGAPVSSDAFHRWILGLCGGEAPAPPPMHARPYDGSWLATLDGETSDEEEVVHLDGEVAEEAPTEPIEDDLFVPEARPAMPLVVRRDLAAYAAAAHAQRGLGVVVVDLRDGAYVTGTDLLERSRYVGAATPEVLALGVKPLLDIVAQRPAGSLFVYAIRLPSDRVETGVAPTTPLTAPPTVSPRTDASPPPTGTAPPDGRWLVRIASRSSLAGAEADLERYAPRLTDLGLRPELRISPRGEAIAYEVVIGPFPSSEAASDARSRADDIVPVPMTLLRLD